VPRPAPKRRADVPAVRLDTESVGGERSANKGPTAPRHCKPGSRRATRRSSLIPTPAVLGATALVIAGGGAVLLSSNSGATETSDPTVAQLAAQPGAGPTYARGGGVLVSRSVDRETLQRQARMQVRQRNQALADLADQSEKLSAEIKANQWVLPVVGYTLSARWGETSYLWATYHTGLDFSAPEGTKIVSVAHCTVIDTLYDSAYGNLVKTELDDGTQIWYAHQTSYVVSVGEEIDPGQLIGYVGATGNVTGPHLHLEVRIPDGTEDGQDIDPYTALINHGVQP